jgi:hypothetical protein
MSQQSDARIDNAGRELAEARERLAEARKQVAECVSPNPDDLWFYRNRLTAAIEREAEAYRMALAALGRI